MKSTNSKLALGLLGGVAVGALLGILFAPDKGSNTRKKIADKGKDYADDLKTKYDTLLGSVTRKYENLFQEGEDLLADGKSRYEQIKSEGKAKFDELKDEAKSKFDEAKKDVSAYKA